MTATTYLTGAAKRRAIISRGKVETGTSKKRKPPRLGVFADVRGFVPSAGRNNGLHQPW